MARTAPNTPSSPPTTPIPGRPAVLRRAAEPGLAVAALRGDGDGEARLGRTGASPVGRDRIVAAFARAASLEGGTNVVAMQRVSESAVEAAERVEDAYAAAMRDGRITAEEHARLRRLMRGSVRAAVVTDEAVVGAVRRLRRNVDLAPQSLPDDEPEPPAAAKAA